jgi:hypothetical protein
VYDYALSCECLCLCQCRHWRRGTNAFSSHRAPSAVRHAHERDGEIPLPLSEGVALKHGCLCPTDVTRRHTRPWRWTSSRSARGGSTRPCCRLRSCAPSRAPAVRREARV